MKNLDSPAPILSTFISLSRDIAWQSQLRRSVSLYLALGSQPINTHELETLLQRTEEELVQYLLQGERPTATAIKHAQLALDVAQNNLLQSEADVQQLLQTLSTDQALFYAEPAPVPSPAAKSTP